MFTNPVIAICADGCEAVGGGMFECPGDVRRDDFGAFPESPVFNAVTRTEDCRFASDRSGTSFPRSGTLSAEVEGRVGHGVSVVRNDPGALASAIGPTKRTLVVVESDVLGHTTNKFERYGHRDTKSGPIPTDSRAARLL
jgi:hypothetical protein